jgi:hypothetical protein
MKEYSRNISVSRNISRKNSQYSLEKLPLHLCQHLVPKMLPSEHKVTQKTVAGDLITMDDHDVDVLNNIITVSAIKKCSERTEISEHQGSHSTKHNSTERYRKIDSRNTSKNFTNIGKSVTAQGKISVGGVV